MKGAGGGGGEAAARAGGRALLERRRELCAGLVAQQRAAAEQPQLRRAVLAERGHEPQRGGGVDAVEAQLGRVAQPPHGGGDAQRGEARAEPRVRGGAVAMVEEGEAAEERDEEEERQTSEEGGEDLRERTGWGDEARSGRDPGEIRARSGRDRARSGG